MPLVMIDAAMPLGYINEEVIADLEKLEPFGRANEKPLFAQQHLSVLRLSRIGKNRNVVKSVCYGTRRHYYGCALFWRHRRVL